MNHGYISYVLLIQKEQPGSVTVGKLGTFQFPAGYYLYVGSAKQHLQTRIQRHIRDEKNHYWHIDYLLKNANVEKVYVSERPECQLGKDLGTTRNKHVIVERFGASDCGCRSHLLHPPEKPNLSLDPYSRIAP